MIGNESIAATTASAAAVPFPPDCVFRIASRLRSMKSDSDYFGNLPAKLPNYAVKSVAFPGRARAEGRQEESTAALNFLCCDKIQNRLQTEGVKEAIYVMHV